MTKLLEILFIRNPLDLSLPVPMGTVNQDGSAVIMRLKHGQDNTSLSIEEPNSHLSPVLPMQPCFETRHFEALRIKSMLVSTARGKIKGDTRSRESVNVNPR